jgi:hypothetical protein
MFALDCVIRLARRKTLDAREARHSMTLHSVFASRLRHRYISIKLAHIDAVP